MALSKKELDAEVLIVVAQINGEEQGEMSMTGTNTQDDGNVQTIMEKATAEWFKWARENNIDTLNTTKETYDLMSEAFVDGYTNGFVKRFTEGE